MSETEPEILARLNDGRSVPTLPCDCGHCGNEWFVPHYSEEWNPSFCPYCGIKFIGHEHGGDPADFKPAITMGDRLRKAEAERDALMELIVQPWTRDADGAELWKINLAWHDTTASKEAAVAAVREAIRRRAVRREPHP